MPTANINAAYDAGTNTATFTFPGFTSGILPDGRYRATLQASGISQQPAQNTVFEFFFLNGDATRDARVNLNDFNVLAANFGQTPRDFTQGDFNYDNTVTLDDFNILAARFGATVAPASTPAANPFATKRVADDGDREEEDLLA